jgi:hypothetical protein
MARHIRFPGIVDVVLVSDPAEIRALNEERAIDRNFVARGPLVNRLITARIRRWFQIRGERLPSLVPRGDVVRAERQSELAAKLAPSAGRLWTDAQIDALAAYVSGGSDADTASIMTQQIVGNLFDPRYRADQATWKAARMIDRFRDGFSPIQIVWQLTGQLRRARDLMVERAQGDRWCMHGTAIGVHGIVHALDRMRQLRAAPTARSLSGDAVLGQCLAPPTRVPRTVETRLETPVVDGSLREGAVLVLQLATAAAQAPDAETVFMRGHWNACPAHAFVTRLLLTVWRRSVQQTGTA